MKVEAVTKQPFNVLLRDIHTILQTEVNFIIMSHNLKVIIITILQASHEGTDVDADEGPATKSGLRNPPIENIFIGLSCGDDQCGFR